MNWYKGALQKIYERFPTFGKPPVFLSKDGPEKTPILELGKRRMELRGGSQTAARRRLESKKVEAVVEPPISEDYAIADDEIRIYAVADGVSSGGHGEVASQIATEEIAQTIREERQKKDGRSDEELMRQALERAADRVRQAGQDDPALIGMDTTFSGFFLGQESDGSVYAVVGQVGDSRVYRFDAQHLTLQRLTDDSSVLNLLSRPEIGLLSPAEAYDIDQSEQKGAGAILNDQGDLFLKRLRERLTELEADKAKLLPIEQKQQAMMIKQLRHVIRGFGNSSEGNQGKSAAEILYGMRNMIFGAVKSSSPEDRQVFRVGVKNGDILFAVSDGICDVLTEKRIQERLRTGLTAGEEPTTIFRVLVEEALSNTSPRQKHKVALDKNGQTVGIENDDASIAGVEVRLAADEGKITEAKPQRSEPMRRAEAWEEDPGLVDEWLEEVEQKMAAGQGEAEMMPLVERLIHVLNRQLEERLIRGIEKDELDTLNDKLRRAEGWRRALLERLSRQIKQRVKP